MTALPTEKRPEEAPIVPELARQLRRPGKGLLEKRVLDALKRDDCRSRVLQDHELRTIRFFGGGQFRHQRPGAIEVGEGLRATEPTHGPLPRHAVVADSLPDDLRLVEVDRELCGDRRRAVAVGRLETLGHPSMPDAPRSRGNAGQGRVPVERVDEGILRLNRPIRPRLRTDESQKTVLAGQHLANGVDFIRRQLEGVRDDACGELRADDTGRLEDALFAGLQAIELDVDELEHRVGATARDLGDAGAELPSAVDVPDHPATLEVVDDRDGEERIPARHVMSGFGKLLREGSIRKSTREILRQGGLRQSLEV